MTVSLVSVAATAESQTSVAANYPASIAADDLLLYFVGSKNNTSSHGVPSGFALLDNDTAGAGSESTSDTGSVVASVFDKVATGSESGTEACAISSGSTAQGFIARLTRSGGSAFDIATTTARWTTDNTNPLGVTFDDAIDFAVDDVVLAFVGLNANTHSNVTSPVFTASGITFGSQTAQRFTSTGLGTDMSVSLHSAVVTAGSGSVVASFQASKSTNAAGEGPVLFVRIREASGGGATDLASNETAHSHAAESLTLTTASTLTVADALHAHTADAPTLTTASTLTVADALHAHTADAPTLTTASTLTVADATHAHTADNATLEVAGATTLVVADATHAHTADAPTLTTNWLLTVADASHAHAADNLSLDGAPTLTIFDTAHGQQADALLLSTDSWLVVADAVHTHTADALTLVASGGATADPAAVWAYVMSNGQTAEANVLAIRTLLESLPATAIADAVWAKVLP